MYSPCGRPKLIHFPQETLYITCSDDSCWVLCIIIFKIQCVRKLTNFDARKIKKYSCEVIASHHTLELRYGPTTEIQSRSRAACRDHMCGSRLPCTAAVAVSKVFIPYRMVTVRFFLICSSNSNRVLISSVRLRCMIKFDVPLFFCDCGGSPPTFSCLEQNDCHDKVDPLQQPSFFIWLDGLMPPDNHHSTPTRGTTMWRKA